MKDNANQTANSKESKTITNLTAGSQIRVAGILGKITVETLKAVAAENGETIEYHTALDKKFNRPTQWAWTMQHAGIITSDYEGKAEAHAKDMAELAAAPLVSTGDVLVIDGEEYIADVLGNYSDPVKLIKL